MVCGFLPRPDNKPVLLTLIYATCPCSVKINTLPLSGLQYERADFGVRCAVNSQPALDILLVRLSPSFEQFDSNIAISLANSMMQCSQAVNVRCIDGRFV